MLKVWRPRISKKSPSINREYNFFAIVCRSAKEADAVEEALVRTFVRFRKKPFTKVVAVIKEKGAK